MAQQGVAPEKPAFISLRCTTAVFPVNLSVGPYGRSYESFTFYVVCLLLGGCVGVGAFTSTTWQESVSVNNNPGAPAATKSQVTSSSRHSGARPLIEKKGESETWVYEQENEWCGALIVVIPLMLPTCEARETYVFSGNTLTRHEVTSTKFSGLMCSIFPMCPNGSNCKLCSFE